MSPVEPNDVGVESVKSVEMRKQLRPAATLYLPSWRPVFHTAVIKIVTNEMLTISASASA